MGRRPAKERDKLTDTFVQRLKARAKNYVEWDTALPGFGISVSRGGAKSWLLKYVFDGKPRWFTFAEFPEKNAEQARAQAGTYRGLVRDGLDPKQERARIAEERKLQLEAEANAPTVAKACEEFLQLHVEANNKPRTIEGQKIAVNNYIKPRLGEKKVKDLTLAELADLHSSIEKKTQANRVLACVSKMLNWCETKGYRDLNSNPCKLITRHRETRRQRYLKPEEMAALEAELSAAEAERPYIVGAIRLLARTSARLSEVLELTWDRVDLINQCFLIPAGMHKTGEDMGDKLIAFGPGALKILKGLKKLSEQEKHESPYVIRGQRIGGRLVNLEKPWGEIRQAVTENHEGIDITDVHLHDLRHTGASIAAKAGHTLHAIGGSMGHLNQATTARYAHLMDETRVAVARDVDAAWETARDTKGCPHALDQTPSR